MSFRPNLGFGRLSQAGLFAAAALLALAGLGCGGPGLGPVAAPAASPTVGARLPDSVTPSPAVVPTVSPAAVPVPTPMATSTRAATATPTRAPGPSSIFGVEMANLTTAGGLDRVAEAGAGWTRKNGLLWSVVEPMEGVRNWAAVAALEAELAQARARGLEVILIVRSTPAWAAGPSGKACGPIRADKLAAFGSFMADVADRYAAQPYGVRYWELWNEPDVDTGLLAGDSVFGCWGDPGDEDFGGRAYAEMLKVVYPRMKAVNPGAQVLVGGLLLDCDPALSEKCAASRTANFLRGILRGGGGDSFDGVSFHAYDYNGAASASYSNGNWATQSGTTGPVLLAKAAFLRRALAEAGVSKYLMNTEVAVLCTSCSNNPDFEMAKARHVAQSYAAAMSVGLRANIWYSALGWRNSGLVAPDLKPLPAHSAFKVAAAQLGPADYQGKVLPDDLGGATGVMGYKFRRAGGEVWMLWSADAAPHPVRLAVPPAAVTDALGASLAAGDLLTVEQTPLYLLWR